MFKSSSVVELLMSRLNKIFGQTSRILGLLRSHSNLKNAIYVTHIYVDQYMILWFINYNCIYSDNS
jgi:hypothetical protein